MMNGMLFIFRLPSCPKIKLPTFVTSYGSVVWWLGRRTSDREIASSTPGRWSVHCRVAQVNSAFHPSGAGKSSTSLLVEVHLCRVAGNTVLSHMAGDAA